LTPALISPQGVKIRFLAFPTLGGGREGGQSHLEGFIYFKNIYPVFLESKDVNHIFATLIKIEQLNGRRPGENTILNPIQKVSPNH
jgi:hypothetical protein